MPCFAPFQYNDIRVGIQYRWDWIALCIFVGMISTFLKITFLQVEEMVSSLDKVVGGQMEKFIKESPFISVIPDESIDIACSRNS